MLYWAPHPHLKLDNVQDTHHGGVLSPLPWGARASLLCCDSLLFLSVVVLDEVPIDGLEPVSLCTWTCLSGVLSESIQCPPSVWQASRLQVCDPVTEPRTRDYAIALSCRLLSHIICLFRAGQPPPLNMKNLSIFRQRSILSPLPTAILSGPSKCAQG